MKEFAVVELNGSDVIVHESFDDFDAAEAAVRNIKRRVAVIGEVVATSVYEDVVESNFVAQDGYISFGDAARLLNVRYQQVFQRAVTKGKMAWRQSPENEVLLADVLVWQSKRGE